MDIGLLLLRFAVGLTLAAHGVQKLSTRFGGYGLDGTGGFMEALGFVPGRRYAFLAGLAETAGGLLLALGLVTPGAASIVFAVMLVAAVTVHVRKGFFAANGGYEFTMVMGISGLSLAFTGPGAFSLDAVLGLHLAGALWGAAAVLVGLAGAGIQLARRHHAPAPQQATA